jgi:pimeloyl-ACP methyl ester carboxylesterase
MTNAGYRVLAPSLACFSKKSLPKDGDCTWANQAKYMMGFLDTIEEKIHYVGHDKGGMLTNLLVATNRDKFKTVVTMCIGIPATSLEMTFSNPIQLFNIWYTVFFNFKGYADDVFKFQSYKFVDILWSSWCPGWQYPKEMINSVKMTLCEPGVTESALDSYRQTMQDTTNELKSNLILDIPVLYIGGKKDGCLNEKSYSKNDDSKHRKGSTIKLLNCGHFPQRELPQEFCKILIEFYESNS